MGQMKREIQSILAGGQPVSDETGNTWIILKRSMIRKDIRRETGFW